jgi:hypothetical protein
MNTIVRVDAYSHGNMYRFGNFIFPNQLLDISINYKNPEPGGISKYDCLGEILSYIMGLIEDRHYPEFTIPTFDQINQFLKPYPSDLVDISGYDQSLDFDQVLEIAIEHWKENNCVGLDKLKEICQGYNFNEDYCTECQGCYYSLADSA